MVLLEATLVESTRDVEDVTTKIAEPKSPEHVASTVQTALIVEAKEVNVDDDSVVGIRKKSLWIAGAIFLFLLVGVGVVGGVVVGGEDDDDDDEDDGAVLTPTIAPDTLSPTGPASNRAIGSFRESLPPYTQKSLEDATSPQSSALSWLLSSADEDRYSDLRLVQRFVLATLYFSTNGERWYDNDGWLSDANECDWSTEAFDICTGQVYQYLILSERNLVGTLPKEIAMLTNLIELDLGTNQLRGSIPTEIALLPNLEALWLYENRLGEAIPTELGTVSQLFILDLVENNLSGRVPDQLSQLTLLTELWLNINRLSGPFPVWISTLPNLEFLYLSENRFEGRVPASLSNLVGLRVLELRALGLTGTFPKELWGSFTEIDYLDISQNQLKGNIGSEIGFLTVADGFEIYANEFSGPIPTEIGLMQNVSYVDLSDNFLTGEIPSELALLENLETLHLYDNLIVGAVPEQLCARVTNDGLDLAVDCDFVQCDCACDCLWSAR
uniref:L domain-like protein n=1 Tax=Amphora coffeiformis TaxID=265554 RepID=A0A7S3L6V9_9STRA|eukprot:scaffold7190_cov193-Amphora_coffeaeformis.AAC.12